MFVIILICRWSINVLSDCSDFRHASLCHHVHHWLTNSQLSIHGKHEAFPVHFSSILNVLYLMQGGHTQSSVSESGSCDLPILLYKLCKCGEFHSLIFCLCICTLSEEKRSPNFWDVPRCIVPHLAVNSEHLILQEEDDSEPDVLYRSIVLEMKGHDPAVMTSYLKFLEMTCKELEVKYQRLWVTFLYSVEVLSSLYTYPCRYFHILTYRVQHNCGSS